MEQKKRACDPCRKSKMRCDGLKDCFRCIKWGRTCVYSEPKKKGPSKSKLIEDPNVTVFLLHRDSKGDATLTKISKGLSPSPPTPPPSATVEVETTMVPSPSSSPSNAATNTPTTSASFSSFFSTCNFPSQTSPLSSSPSSSTNQDREDVHSPTMDCTQPSSTHVSVSPSHPTLHRKKKKEERKSLSKKKPVTFKDFIGSSRRSSRLDEKGPTLLDIKVLQDDFGNLCHDFNETPHTLTYCDIEGNGENECHEIQTEDLQKEQRYHDQEEEEEEIVTTSSNQKNLSFSKGGRHSVKYTNRENSLVLVQMSSNYFRVITSSIESFVQEKLDFLEDIFGKPANFETVDIRVASLLSSFTRSCGEKQISDQYLQFAIEECQRTWKKDLEFPELVNFFTSTCSLSTNFACVSQEKFREYSGMCRSMAKKLLNGDQTTRMLVSMYLNIVADESPPIKIEGLEQLALFKYNSHFSHNQSILDNREEFARYENEMLSNNLIIHQCKRPSRERENKFFTFLYFEERLTFVRNIFFSYCPKIWETFYTDSINEHSGHIPQCLPRYIGFYMIKFIEETEELKVGRLTHFMSDLNPCILKFFIYEAMGDHIPSRRELYECSELISDLLECLVFFPGAGLLPTIFILARYFILNLMKKQTESAIRLIKYWSLGLDHVQQYLGILKMLQEYVNKGTF